MTELEEKRFDPQRSILLVDIMNAIGFSNSERGINRKYILLFNLLTDIFPFSYKKKVTIVGSMSEGIRGGIYSIGYRDQDIDLISTATNIKLYTAGTDDIKHPLLCLNGDYDAYCYVKEDVTCPGYVKLQFSVEETNMLYLVHCSTMHENKMYLSNSRIKDCMYEEPTKPSKQASWLPVPVLFDPCPQREINGPAHTSYTKDYRGVTAKADKVFCIHYDMWPDSAKSFISRRKPNNWLSNSMLGNIQNQGCDLVPVGHHDSNNNDIQWRISFPGERSLLLDLNDVQLFCYVLIKIILKENLNTSQMKVVSSFHIKHVLFWCVELCSCQWVESNYITCLKICLERLIEMIKARRIPHYIIESRNLFNSKMTVTMSTEIVDVLSKYVTTDGTNHILTLVAFDKILKITHYRNTVLKRTAFLSTIMACFKFVCVLSILICMLHLHFGVYTYHTMPQAVYASLKTFHKIGKKGKKCICITLRIC